MHADQLANVRRNYDGIVPPTWLAGDTPYQKAAVIAAVAHHETKAPDDPELVACDLTFREQCIGIVESIMRGNEPDDREFSRHAFALWQQTDEYRAAHPSSDTRLTVTA